jgi:hypothetical protein
MKSNGKEYKQTAVIKESWQWPAGNFNMQKPCNTESGARGF